MSQTITDTRGLSHLEQRRHAERTADAGPWLIDYENGIPIAPVTTDQADAFRAAQARPSIYVDSKTGKVFDGVTNEDGDYWPCWVDGAVPLALVPIRHAREQLESALVALTTGTGTIQERITEAWIDSLVFIDPEADLPGDMGERWKMVRALLTHEQAAAGEGNLRATVLAMSDEAAAEAAHHILGFYWSVRSAED